MQLYKARVYEFVVDNSSMRYVCYVYNERLLKNSKNEFFSVSCRFCKKEILLADPEGMRIVLGNENYHVYLDNLYDLIYGNEFAVYSSYKNEEESYDEYNGSFIPILIHIEVIYGYTHPARVVVQQINREDIKYTTTFREKSPMVKTRLLWNAKH